MNFKIRKKRKNIKAEKFVKKMKEIHKEIKVAVRVKDSKLYLFLFLFLFILFFRLRIRI